MLLSKHLKNVLFGILFGVIGLIALPTHAYAGTDLSATCPAIGTCSIAPSGTPLINEASWIPGSSVTQRFTVSNTSSQNGFVGLEAVNYLDNKNLGEVIYVEIHENSPTGNLVYAGVHLQDFRDDAFFTIDTINAGQTIEYYFIATMQPTAGNEYQAAFARFDINLGLEIAAIPPISGGGDGSGSSSGSGGSTTPAEPPVCNDQTPTSAPSVSITSVGTNTVSLNWTPVSPVSHYALIFTRTSDGAQYGSANIGNVTNFTITNLSGGANYSFEVFGVNGCAPGPRGSTGSGTIPGDFIDGRPLGGGQVLGETDAETEQEEESESETSDSAEGVIAGVTDEQCQAWRFYIPWILLVAQAILVALNEYYFKKNHGLTKHFINIGVTLASIFIFYLLKTCPCYESGSLWILVWLCSWYWIVAAIESIIIRVFSYAFMEEVETRR